MSNAARKITEIPKADDDRITLPRREWGGYHVKLDGVTLGWVVKDEEGGWDAYRKQPDKAKGRRVAFHQDLRRTAVNELLFESRALMRWDDDEGRWEPREFDMFGNEIKEGE